MTLKIPTREEMIEVLKTVKDPELGIDIWTLGLVYHIKTTDTGVAIEMTLTSPFCPFGNEIVLSVEKAVQKITDGEVMVDITFEPAWQPSEELRTMLGL